MEDYDYNQTPIIRLCQECNHPYSEDGLYEIEDGTKYLTVCRDCKMEIQSEQSAEESYQRSLHGLPR